MPWVTADSLHVELTGGGQVAAFEKSSRLCTFQVHADAQFIAAASVSLRSSKGSDASEASRSSVLASRLPNIDSLLAARGPIDVSALLNSRLAEPVNGGAAHAVSATRLADEPVPQIVLVATAGVSGLTLHAVPIYATSPINAPVFEVPLTCPDFHEGSPIFHVGLSPLLEPSAQGDAVAVLTAYRRGGIEESSSVSGGRSLDSVQGSAFSAAESRGSSIRIDAWLVRVSADIAERPASAARLPSSASLGDSGTAQQASPLRHLLNVAAASASDGACVPGSAATPPLIYLVDKGSTASSASGIHTDAMADASRSSRAKGAAVNQAAGHVNAPPDASPGQQHTPLLPPPPPPTPALSAERLTAVLLDGIAADCFVGAVRQVAGSGAVAVSLLTVFLRSTSPSSSLVVVTHSHSAIASSSALHSDGRPRIPCEHASEADWQLVHVPDCDAVAACEGCCTTIAPANGTAADAEGSCSEHAFMLLTKDPLGGGGGERGDSHAAATSVRQAHNELAFATEKPAPSVRPESTGPRPAPARTTAAAPVFISRGLNMALDGGGGTVGLWGRRSEQQEQRHGPDSEKDGAASSCSKTLPSAAGSSSSSSSAGLDMTAFLSSLLEKDAAAPRQLQPLNSTPVECVRISGGSSGSGATELFLIAPAPGQPATGGQTRPYLGGGSSSNSNGGQPYHPLLMPSRPNNPAASVIGALPDLLVQRHGQGADASSYETPPGQGGRLQQLRPAQALPGGMSSVASAESSWSLRVLRVSTPPHVDAPAGFAPTSSRRGVLTCSLSTAPLPLPRGAYGRSVVALCCLSLPGKAPMCIGALVYRSRIRNASGVDTPGATSAGPATSDAPADWSSAVHLRVVFVSATPVLARLGDFALLPAQAPVEGEVGVPVPAAHELTGTKEIGAAAAATAEAEACSLTCDSNSAGLGAARRITFHALLSCRPVLGTCEGGHAAAAAAVTLHLELGGTEVECDGSAAARTTLHLLRRQQFVYQSLQTASALAPPARPQYELPVGQDQRQSKPLPVLAAENRPSAESAPGPILPLSLSAGSAASVLRAEALAAAACAQATAALALAAAADALSSTTATTNVPSTSNAVRDAHAALQAAGAVVRAVSQTIPPLP
jgi:hypothetical protein